MVNGTYPQPRVTFVFIKTPTAVDSLHDMPVRRAVSMQLKSTPKVLLISRGYRTYLTPYPTYAKGFVDQQGISYILNPYPTHAKGFVDQRTYSGDIVHT